MDKCVRFVDGPKVPKVLAPVTSTMKVSMTEFQFSQWQGNQGRSRR
jgi:hypothetical protein